MSKINEAIHSIHHLDAVSAKDKWINNIHPLGKLIVTYSYILAVISFNKYDITGLAGMGIYLLIMILICDIPLEQSFKQIRIVLMLVSIVGIANPFFDKTVMFRIGNLVITGGMISMITLMMKGMFTVCASYLLIITTSIERICLALRILHVPKALVTVILLIYRYIIVFLKEVERMTQSYELRAPKQKGINIKVWGSFVGQLLLRSIDRASVVYESMLLRGYDGEFSGSFREESKWKSIGFTIIFIIMIIIFRIFPVFKMVGNIFV